MQLIHMVCFSMQLTTRDLVAVVNAVTRLVASLVCRYAFSGPATKFVAGTALCKNFTEKFRVLK